LEPVETREGGEATKWLWRSANSLIESVQIRAPGRVTSCLSSQVGCAVRCAFCATGQGGFERQLETNEMVEQYLQMRARSGLHSSHVVFMGMGEPLYNYEAVMRAVRQLNRPTPEGVGLAARRITISTVGIVPGIKRLAGENLQLELAISLHAPDEATREKLIPAAKRQPLREILQAAAEYSKLTHRLVTYEYVLLAGVNDAPEQARELGRLLRGRPCKVNLIPFNPVAGADFKPSAPPAQRRFKQILDEAHVPTTIRVSKGRKVDAACGQLRASGNANIGSTERSEVLPSILKK
jgi:23S rRNA (adenine2503-C2)-methyltransferase